MTILAHPNRQHLPADPDLLTRYLPAPYWRSLRERVEREERETPRSRDKTTRREVRVRAEEV